MLTTRKTTNENEIFTPAADVAIHDSRIENYKKVLKKNVTLRNKLIQDNDELSAGVLMLAEIAGIQVPANLKARDIISELAVILENFIESKNEVKPVQDLTKPSLSELLSKDNILEMTKNCIVLDEILDKSKEEDAPGCEANGNLWQYLTDLAAAQGMDLPEYEP